MNWNIPATRVLGVVTVAALVAACSGSEDGVRSESADSVAVTDLVETDAAETTGAGTAASTVTATTAVTSATAAPDTAVATTGTAAAGEGWTVLVYSIADTDLEPFLLVDVGEMGEVGSSENLDIVALVDRAAGYSSDGVLGLDDWQGAKLLHIGDGTASELADVDDLNTGDPDVLASFVAEGISAAPAAHYALIITDHGASWPGVGGDESAGGDGLTLDEMNDAISAGLAEAGVDKLDLLGFDACLMASYEVASLLAPLADRMVASEELEPGHGWDYRALQVLEDDPATDVDALATALVDAYSQHAAAEGTDAGITLALIDLEQMPLVDAAVGAFTDVLVERAAEVAPMVGQTRADTLGFGSSPDPEQDTHMADLAMLASQIGVEAPAVAAQANALAEAIDGAVLHSVAGAGMPGATGMSVYFPPYAELFDSAYSDVESTTAWGTFLATFYEIGQNIPEEEQPRFIDRADGTQVFFDEDGVNIAGTFDIAAQDNLAEATINYGIVGDDGSVSFIGDEPAQIAEDGSGLALGIYDLTTLTITDGQDTAYAYLSLTFDEDGGVATIDVPLYYYPPDSDGDEPQDVLLSLSVDSATGDVLDETYYLFDAETGTYGELTADPNGIIVPQELYVSADGEEAEWLPTSDVGLYADLPLLQYSFEPLPPGTPLYLELTVTDFGGNSDSVFAQVEVP